jgi:hypothetical protein
VVLDERQAEEILAEAADEIKRGALTSALAKIDRAAALHPSSERVVELRKAVEDALAARERARQRAEAIRVAMERAQEKLIGDCSRKPWRRLTRCWRSIPTCRKPRA